MTAESWLLKESSGELVIAHVDDIFQTQRSSALVPCRLPAQDLVTVSRTLPRVGQTTRRVAAAPSRVHCPLQRRRDRGQKLHGC